MILVQETERHFTEHLEKMFLKEYVFSVSLLSSG
jgi:hypothetical protein